MKFKLPIPGTLLEVVKDVKVSADAGSINKNTELWAFMTHGITDSNKASKVYWQTKRSLRDDENYQSIIFDFTLPAGIQCKIGQVYVRKGGWYNNSIVLVFDKTQPEPFGKKTIRIFTKSFEEIEFKEV
jgi:hypothetical protein